MIDEDAPHHLGRHGEEMGAILPAHAVVSHQAQVGLVHEGGRLERVAASLTLHIAVSQAAEFLINDGRQAVERALVSIAPGLQKRADVLCTQHLLAPSARRRLIIPPATHREISASPLANSRGFSAY